MLAVDEFLSCERDSQILVVRVALPSNYPDKHSWMMPSRTGCANACMSNVRMHLGFGNRMRMNSHVLEAVMMLLRAHLPCTLVLFPQPQRYRPNC
jgi:hypothetical protein